MVANKSHLRLKSYHLGKILSRFKCQFFLQSHSYMMTPTKTLFDIKSINTELEAANPNINLGIQIYFYSVDFIVRRLLLRQK